jgi:uncharacterized protein with GYD domain
MAKENPGGQKPGAFPRSSAVHLRGPGEPYSGVILRLAKGWEASRRGANGKENAMQPIYVTLLQYTERGVHHVKDTVKREEAFKTRAKKHGVTFKEAIWTLGAHDGVFGFRGPRRRDRYSCHLERGRTGQCSHRDHARLHRCRDGKVTG